MMGTMASSPTKKSLPAVLGGVVLVLVAGYFGIDLSGDDSSSTASTASSVSGAGSQTGTTAGAAASESGLDTCSLDSLPEEADDTVEDILAGGPYEYPDNDNARFGNYEGVLPKESKNFYREYTVETPGSKSRGARRIVTGGGSETDPDVWFYTDDHYESFCEIPEDEAEGLSASGGSSSKGAK